MSVTAEQVIAEISMELLRAQNKHGPMRGMHEGYAVILEELDELWAEVKAQHPDMAKIRKEAIQIAAMGARFALDVCATPTPPPANREAGGRE